MSAKLTKILPSKLTKILPLKLSKTKLTNYNCL